MEGAKVSKHIKVIVVLPCDGSPYIWKNRLFNTHSKTKKQSLLHATTLQEEIGKVVRGDVARVSSDMMIHPMFENRWKIAGNLCKKPDVMIFVNGNGRDKCCPNMACIPMERVIQNGKSYSCEEYLALPLRAGPPFFGEVALLIPYQTLREEINPEAMKLVRIEDFYEEFGLKKPETPSDEKDYERNLGGYIYEPFADEDHKKAKAYAKERGWFIASSGQVYMRPTGRPDEKNNEESDDE